MADLGSQVTGERHPGPTVPHAIEDIVVFTQMGKLVEGIANEAHPGVGKSGGFQLRESPDHQLANQRCTFYWIGFLERSATAKKNSPVLRAGTVVHHQLAGIGNDSAAGKELLGKSFLQRLGRDHVGSDGDDAISLPWRQIASVTACTYDDFLRRDDALGAGGPEAPPGSFE